MYPPVVLRKYIIQDLIFYAVRVGYFTLQNILNVDNSVRVYILYEAYVCNTIQFQISSYVVEKGKIDACKKKYHKRASSYVYFISDIFFFCEF